MTTRTKKAGDGNPPATTTRQESFYWQPTPASRASLLEQAAEVLLLLEFPLAEMEQLALTCLFEWRLRRAYAGGRR